MSQRAAIDLVPEEIRMELEARLVKTGFSGYRDLADWLQEQGFEISKSQVHRFGQSFQDRLERLKTATEQAKMLQQQLGDDAGALNEALIRTVQAQLFELFEKIELDPKKVDVHKLMRNVAHLAQASVQQNKWAAEARDKIRQRMKKLEKEAAAGGEGAPDLETVRRATRELYGIFE